MLHIILTSYNRPVLLRRTLESLQRQTLDRWRCLLMDDDSNEETRAVIEEFRGPQIHVFRRRTTTQERVETTRYAVLINDALNWLDDGIVGYLCDNVEYQPRLVESVLGYFERNPATFAGFVMHQRDIWRQEEGGPDGVDYLGLPELWGHWRITPPSDVQALEFNQVDGWLDHSQVFHRLPVNIRWSENIENVAHGDGVFFRDLAAHHGPIKRIHEMPLTFEHLLKRRMP